MSSCRKANEFLREEKDALLIEFEGRRKRLERELGKSMTLKEAEASFLDKGFKEFAEGFRLGFCATCEGRDECRDGK